MSSGRIAVVLAIVAGCATSTPTLEPIDWGNAGTLGEDCRFYMGDVDIERPPLEPCEAGLSCDMTTMNCVAASSSSTTSTP